MYTPIEFLSKKKTQRGGVEFFKNIGNSCNYSAIIDI